MKIYTITVCSQLKKDTAWGNEFLGSSRTWGFFQNKDDALYALHNNVTDMWETCYDYAILECYEEGTVAETESRQCFQFNKDKNGYFEITNPEYLSPLGLIFG